MDQVMCPVVICPLNNLSKCRILFALWQVILAGACMSSAHLLPSRFRLLRALITVILAGEHLFRLVPCNLDELAGGIGLGLGWMVVVLGVMLVLVLGLFYRHQALLEATGCGIAGMECLQLITSGPSALLQEKNLPALQQIASTGGMAAGLLVYWVSGGWRPTLVKVAALLIGSSRAALSAGVTIGEICKVKRVSRRCALVWSLLAVSLGLHALLCAWRSKKRRTAGKQNIKDKQQVDTL